ncbi:MAG: hypothetical protein V3S97_01645 [Candidatus Bathyarchaeia archaeon]
MRFIIGIGDLLITGAIGLSLFCLKYPPWRTYIVLLFAISLATAIGLMIDGIPALPIVAFATVPYIALQPSRKEKE